MDYPNIDDKLSITGQIFHADLVKIKALNYTFIINNRPDKEDMSQPDSNEIKREANTLGLSYLYIPIRGFPIQADSVESFRTAIESPQDRILAHCFSGMRSTCLWALSQMPDVPDHILIERAARIGQNIASIFPILKDNYKRLR